MKKKLTIGFISAFDPNDKCSWSGIYFRMVKELERQGFIVLTLGPVRFNKILGFTLLTIGYISKIYKKIFGKKYKIEHSHLVSFFYGRFFIKKIKENRIDVIFAPVASTEIAHLQTEIPICYYSDATVSVMIDYYESFSGLLKQSIKESIEIEQLAMNKSKIQVFSSKWAYDSALMTYNAQKAYIVKMGANLESNPPEDVIFKNDTNTFKLLFIGVDWKRKGGEIVYETLEKLDERGYDIFLTVVGSIPPKKHPKMKVIPHLNKNLDADRCAFEDLLRDSNLFFLPTRADCTPIVFCEANAFGVPVISTITGGVSSVIEEDINGYLLPLSATSEEYFKLIVTLISDKEKMRRLTKTSREKYEKELNWNSWGDKMKDLLYLTYNNENYEKLP